MLVPISRGRVAQIILELSDDGLRFRADPVPQQKGFCSLFYQHAGTICQISSSLHLGKLQKRCQPAAVQHVVGKSVTEQIRWYGGEFVVQAGGGGIDDEIEMLPGKIMVMPGCDIAVTGELAL